MAPIYFILFNVLILINHIFFCFVYWNPYSFGIQNIWNINQGYQATTTSVRNIMDNASFTLDGSLVSYFGTNFFIIFTVLILICHMFFVYLHLTFIYCNRTYRIAPGSMFWVIQPNCSPSILRLLVISCNYIFCCKIHAIDF